MASHVAVLLLVRPLDDHIQQSRFNSELHDSTTLDRLFDPGPFATSNIDRDGFPLALLSAALAEAVVLVGAGDIADCKALDSAHATARLLDAIPGTVFTVGDHAYRKGTAREFADATGPRGAVTVSGLGPPLATMTTRPTGQIPISTTSVRPRESPARATTATASAPGT